MGCFASQQLSLTNLSSTIFILPMFFRGMFGKSSRKAFYTIFSDEKSFKIHNSLQISEILTFFRKKFQEDFAAWLTKSDLRSW